jgi:hypothetical protein
MSMCVCECMCMFVCPPSVSALTQLTDLHEIWYERCADLAHSNALRCHYVRRVITSEKRELLRWERHYRHLLWDPRMLFGNRSWKYMHNLLM